MAVLYKTIYHPLENFNKSLGPYIERTSRSHMQSILYSIFNESLISSVQTVPSLKYTEALEVLLIKFSSS